MMPRVPTVPELKYVSTLCEHFYQHQLTLVCVPFSGIRHSKAGTQQTHFLLLRCIAFQSQGEHIDRCEQV